MSGEPQATALVLVDLQHDFLERPGLVPDAGTLSARIAGLLGGCRSLGLPVVHAHTVTRPDGADRMPHWERAGLRACVEGTPGAAPPPSLAPAEGELVLRKQFYSAFGDLRLDPWLRSNGVSRILLAGIYLHGCVRATALDAYERGYAVWVADDAVGTTEPVHGELTRAWLAERVATFRPVEAILAELGDTQAAAGRAARFLHRSPCRTAEIVAEVPLSGVREIGEAARAAAAAQPAWAQTDPAGRAALLERWAAGLESARERFVALLVHEIGKPHRFAEEEVGRAVAHARVAAELAHAGAERIAPGVSAVARPLGVVGLVTPWNNPLALPVGKIAPALALGNGVVLKPAPQACGTALALVEVLRRSGCPEGLVHVVPGDAEAGRALAREPAIAAVSLTGSVAAGRVLAALCAAGWKPLQAELGGNNAAIVLADADCERVVPDLVRAAFAFAGQRCTAIRRFVVERAVAPRFEALAIEAVRALHTGEPADPATEVGPLVSAEQRDRVVAAIARARAEGARLLVGGTVPPALAHGAWLLPALLADVAPESAIVQEETFGPVAVLQVARDLDDAIALASGVDQGLVLSVHTRDPRARRRVLEAAQAGIVQLAPGPLAVHPRAPFMGWKASGLGPPEHGRWDAAFYARTQAIYEDGGC